jgi:hypothetical protein
MRRCPALLVAALAFGFALQPVSSLADGLATYTLTSTAGLPAPSGPPPGTPAVTLNGTLSTGSATVSVPSTTRVGVGYQVTGTGIPSGTTVKAIGSSGAQITLSQNATANGGESLTFTPVIAPPQVVALVEPAGGVVTPPSSSPTGPLTVIPSGSQGFYANGVYDFLASKDQNGNALLDSNGKPLQALGLSFYGQSVGQGGLASLANGGILKFSLDVTNPNSPPQLVVPQSNDIKITLQPSDISTGSTGTTGTNNNGSGGTQIGTASIPEPLSVLLWSAMAGASLLRARSWRKRLPAAHA